MIEGLLKFPCSFQKRPLTQWRSSARRDADISKFPLVGVPTGSVNGFDVLDIDLAGMSWLDSVWDRLPPTRAHATRSGGRHLFFQHAQGLRNSASRISDGVDVRADGGFVVWWPRQGLRVLSDAVIAEWPDWLLRLAFGGLGSPVALVGDGAGVGERKHATGLPQTRTLNLFARCKVIQRKVERAEVGKRNLLLHWAACRFGEMVVEGILRPEVAALLLESSAKLCGLWRDDGAAQCRATIKSGIAAGIRDAMDLARSNGNVIELSKRRLRDG